MNMFKKIFGVLAFVVLVGLISTSVEASYLTTYYGSPRSLTLIDSNVNKNYNTYGNYDYGYFGSDSSNNANGLDFFGEGFANNNFGSFSQTGYIDLSDGYSFNKEPCSTRKITGNFKGSYNDYTITEEVCDGIGGNFHKSNNYNNNVNNNLGYNQNNVGANIYQNNYKNSLNTKAVSTHKNTGYGYTYGSATSFGKGTRIIYY